MVDWIKCLPLVGTAISGYETVEAICEGNGKRALWKLGETAVGGVMDTLTIASVGTAAIASTSTKIAAKIAVAEAVIIVTETTVIRAISTTITGKEADKCDGSYSGYFNRAEGSRKIRRTASDAQYQDFSQLMRSLYAPIDNTLQFTHIHIHLPPVRNEIKTRKQKEQDEVKTGNGDQDPDDEPLKWSRPECEGDTLNYDDVLIDHDKMKSKLNKYMPEGVIAVAGKEADKCNGSGGDLNVAQSGRIIRQAAIDAQRKTWMVKDLVRTSNPQCEGDKPDDDDVLTDHDKTKAKLNKNLPKGVKTVRILIHSPNREVSYETIDGYKIVHYSRSIVTKDDLSKGIDVTDDDQKYIKEIGISTKGKSDDARQMLPKELGGCLEYNLFPQTLAANKGHFHHDVVKPLVDFHEKNSNVYVDYQVRLIYNPGQTRPYGFYVLTRCYLNGEVYMDFNHGNGYYLCWGWNPHPNKIKSNQTKLFFEISGTAVSLYKTVETIYESNVKKALWKLSETTVGVSMDTLTVLSVGTAAIASTSVKTAATAAVFAAAKNVGGATLASAVGTTITGKEADKYGGYYNDAKRRIILRRLEGDGQNDTWKQNDTMVRVELIEKPKQDEVQTASDGKDPNDPPEWSRPECAGNKPDDEDVLSDHDKTKAKLDKNLPKRGVKTVNLSAHGPIREVSYETIDGNKIVHYSRSIITKDDLRTGTGVTEHYKDTIRETGINSIEGNSDDAGHILPNVLGGHLEYNLFPQNPSVNRSINHYVVQPLRDFLEQYPNGSVEYQVRLVYNNDDYCDPDDHQTRPYGFYVLTRCYLEDEVYMNFNNNKGYYLGWWWNPHPNINKSNQTEPFFEICEESDSSNQIQDLEE